MKGKRALTSFCIPFAGYLLACFLYISASVSYMPGIFGRFDVRGKGPPNLNPKEQCIRSPTGTMGVVVFSHGFLLIRFLGRHHWLPSPGKQERKMRDVLCNTDVYYVRRSIYLYTRLASSGPLIASTCYSSSIWVIKSLLPKYWEICAAAPICPIIGHKAQIFHWITAFTITHKISILEHLRSPWGI